MQAGTTYPELYGERDNLASLRVEVSCPKIAP